MGIKLGDDVFNIIKRIRSRTGQSEEVSTTETGRHEPTNVIASAFQYGIYGISIWDRNFNLITANSQYADLHKIPSTLLTPGSPLRSIMHNLKARGVLSPDSEPDHLIEFIKNTLAEKGQLTSNIRFSDDTVLEISAERMANGNIAAYLRNATREKMLTKQARLETSRAEAYVNAITRFPVKTDNISSPNGKVQIDQVTRTIATLMEIDWCVVWTTSNVLNEAAALSAYRAVSGIHTQIDNLILPDLVEYIAIMETSRVIAIHDTGKHAFGKVQGSRAPLGEHAHAVLDTPIREDGKIIGVLSCLDTSKARNWTASDKMFALSAASHLGCLMSTSDESSPVGLNSHEVFSSRAAAE